MNNNFIDDIFSQNVGFKEKCFEVYQHQFKNNAVYQAWAKQLNQPMPEAITDIPFLPISFFKTHEVKAGAFNPEIIFTSSGTTGMQTSRHLVKHTAVYEQSFIKAFELFYGPIEQWCVIALLPSYLERSGSSLIYMAEAMIQKSRYKESGFHLYDFDAVAQKLAQLSQQQIPTLLLGVSFALIDFADQFPMQLNNHIVVMETGGMKGRKKEITRAEVHQILCSQLGLASVHAEYGMTELLSQAYSKGNGLFQCPPWMKVFIREEDDPLLVKTSGKGLINIIDLANIDSCSFIATDDIGIVHEDGSFEIIGRADNSDIRGCSLLIA